MTCFGIKVKIYKIWGEILRSKKHLLISVILTLITLLIIIFIFSNSLTVAEQSDKESGVVLMNIQNVLSFLKIPLTLTDKFVRKTAHFIEFFTLGTMLSITFFYYRFNQKKSLIFTPISGLCVAVTDELLQLKTQGRSASVLDVLLDFSGVLFALIIISFIIYITYTRKKNKSE